MLVDKKDVHRGLTELITSLLQWTDPDGHHIFEINGFDPTVKRYGIFKADPSKPETMGCRTYTVTYLYHTEDGANRYVGDRDTFNTHCVIADLYRGMTEQNCAINWRLALKGRPGAEAGYDLLETALTVKAKP